MLLDACEEVVFECVHLYGGHGLGRKDLDAMTRIPWLGERIVPRAPGIAFDAE